MIYVSQEIILAAFFYVACEAGKDGVGQVDESPDGANMALPYLVAEWFEVCLFGRAKRGILLVVEKSPYGANARGAFDCCMVENSGVSCCGEIEVLFYGAGGKP